MNITAINSINTTPACQPIRKINFTQRQQQVENKEPVQNSGDTCSFSNANLQQKYDLACRLAAYYKLQYENLAKNGSCNA